MIPESVKLKLQNKAKRLINTAFLSKTSIIEFAPNGCRKSHMIKCLKHLISCGIQAIFNNRISRIQDDTKNSIKKTPQKYVLIVCSIILKFCLSIKVRFANFDLYLFQFSIYFFSPVFMGKYYMILTSVC